MCELQRGGGAKEVDSNSLITVRLLLLCCECDWAEWKFFQQKGKWGKVKSLKQTPLRFYVKGQVCCALHQYDGAKGRKCCIRIIWFGPWESFNFNMAQLYSICFKAEIELVCRCTWWVSPIVWYVWCGSGTVSFLRLSSSLPICFMHKIRQTNKKYASFWHQAI